ncbi:MAG: hypothetical protein NZM11_06360 [Anaerolineales bacterium]|nr:hypothetical protein [Anaerolineales bacterium]
MDDFWVNLARLSDSLGLLALLLSALFSAYAAWRLRQQNRRLRDLARNTPRIDNFEGLREAHHGVKSIAPVAFALSLTPNAESIRPSVEKFLKYVGWKMDIEELNLNGLDPSLNLEEYVNLLREKRRLFEAKGYTEVHVFISGPIVAGAILGSLYDNWIPVKLYHKPTPAPPHLYEYWMPLL